MSLISPARLLRTRATAAAPRRETILAITPPSAFLLDERVFVSLGILKVAASLEREGHVVEHLDLSGIENYADAASDGALASEARVVLLTATTPQLPAAAKIVRAIREVRPDARVVLGGPHVTLVCAALRQEERRGRIGRARAAMTQLESMVDVLVAGDGEAAVHEAIKPGAPKLIDADDPRGPLFMTSAAYEASALPARHLVDVGSYRYSIEGHSATSLIAQLGCPFGCNFCGGRASSMLRRIRTRSTESVVAEIALLHREHGFTGFMLYDDELNVNQDLVPLMREIARLQDRLGVEFRLRGFVKSELFTDEQAAAMRAAGFRWILCGFEAADPRILDNINKRATVEDNDRVVEVCRRNGLKVKALMSVGHAGESAESIDAVRSWLLRAAPDDFDCTIITTYPGTPYYDEATPHETLPGVWTYSSPRSGDRLYSYDVDFSETAEYYKGDPAGGYRSYVFTDHLAAEEVVRLRDGVERDVRAALGIPFNPGAASRRYEHSMGQGPLPPFIMRRSPSAAAPP